MNLHGIVRGVIGAVNPHVVAYYKVSLGSITNDDGSRTPTYAAPVGVYAQVQALTSRDLAQTDNLNLQAIARTIYLSGTLNGIVRPVAKGGDMIAVGAQVFLVEAVLEQWPDWVKVAVTLQSDESL